MKIYVYQKCTTCKSALSYLKKVQIDFTIIEIDKQTPSREELEQMLDVYGDLRKLFNTSGTIYKELKLSEKLPSLSKEQAFDLLTSNGMLVKRPFLIGKKVGIVGFDEVKWKELLQ